MNTDDKTRLCLRVDTLTSVAAKLAMLDPADRRAVVEAAMQMVDGVGSLADVSRPGVVINIVNTPAN
jgi:hypothetical protein